MSAVAQRLAPFGTTVFARISAQAAARGAVNLGQGFPDFDGPDFVREAAKRAVDEGRNQYCPMQGVPELRRAIAAFFATGGPQQRLELDAEEEITVTPGCTGAIAAATLGLVNPGEEVVLFEPYYDSYRACCAMAGATPRFVTLHGPDFTFDPDELRAAVTPRTRAILVNTPHNPTGRVFTREELQTIADVCLERDLIALSDEVYERLVFEGEHLRLAALPGMRERTLTLSSLGKTFSLTGWKIGWAAGPADLVAGVRAANQFLVYCVATPLQYAAAEALAAPASYYDEFLREYRARRDLLVEGLREAGFLVEPPQGTYFVLADHTPFGVGDDEAFCAHMLEKAGVAAIPPTAFYENKDEGRRYVRFGFCKRRSTLEEACRRLRALRT